MSDRIRIVQVAETRFRRKCGQAKTCGWVVRRGHTSEMLTKSERTSSLMRRGGRWSLSGSIELDLRRHTHWRREIVRCTSPLAQSATAADTELKRQVLEGLEDWPLTLNDHLGSWHLTTRSLDGCRRGADEAAVIADNIGIAKSQEHRPCQVS